MSAEEDAVLIGDLVRWGMTETEAREILADPEVERMAQDMARRSRLTDESLRQMWRVINEAKKLAERLEARP